jgi:hypothetical protein
MKVLAMMVFVVVMMVACGGEMSSAEIVCDRIFSCYESPTYNVNPDKNPFKSVDECHEKILLTETEMDCVLNFENDCDIMSDRIYECLEQL